MPLFMGPLSCDFGDTEPRGVDMFVSASSHEGCMIDRIAYKSVFR